MRRFQRANSARFLWPLIGALLLCIPFYRILLYTDRALFFRDLARDLLVQKSIWAASIRAGDGIPFWNHFALGGTPFYSMIVGGPLNPLNALFLLFPQEEAPRALAFYLWVHYLLFYFGAYRLLRSYHCNRKLSALMACTLGASGYLLSVHSLGHLLSASVAVPWYFYFQRRYFSTNRILYLLLTSATIAWPIYGGDPQHTYMLALISGAAFLKRGKVKDWLLLGSLSFLFAAAQLLPTAVEILRSQRLDIKSEELLYFSFHPLRALEIFYPLFFGNRYGTHEYWGGDYVNFAYKNPFIFSIYPGVLGIIALLLFPLFLKNWWKRKSLELYLLLGFGLGLLLSFGVFFPVPLYDWCARFIPMFGLFRYPERFLFWPMWCVYG
jgi:hypothetical protein